MYSGTCSAGFQSLIFKKKAIVFSTEKFKEPTAITKYGKLVLDYVFSNKLLSKQYYLNVNFPDIEKYNEYKGIKITKLFIRHSDYTYEILDKKEQIYQLYHHHHDIESDDTNDVSVTANGYISITPMSIINYQEKDYEKLIKKIKS